MCVFLFRTFPTDNRNAGNTEHKVLNGCLYQAQYLETSKSEIIVLMMFQMAPHKRVASLLNISSALLSHQLLFFLIGKEKTEEEKVKVEKEEDAEETTNLMDVGLESGKTQRGCEEISNKGLEEYNDRGKQNALGNNDLRKRDLGNDDIVEKRPENK